MPDAETTYTVAIPEPGQVVEVRRRQWVVKEVDESSGNGKPAQHLVSLSSIDEDGLGEELEVIWQIEPGAHVIERTGLPVITDFDVSEHLEAFLDAIRWGAATNADRGFLQAPFRSGIAIEDFQLDPLVRAIDMARANLLIADDVGLGKTIEAGLVIQEMLLRHRARTILVVCPASLLEKWRVEMHEKFGLEFKIVDTEYIKVLRRERGIHANPWTSFPRIITSMDWIKGGEALRLMRDVLPVHARYPRTFDILVVDEAHNVAPAGSANYVLESQRTKAIRMLSPHFQHRLFLTATPHNGYTQSFTALLELLDDQRFSRNILPDEKQLSQVMVRRLKSAIKDADGNPLFPTRELMTLPIKYSEEERSIHKMLEEYCKSRESTCRNEGKGGSFFINSLLKKRLFSSPAAFASTLEKHVTTISKGKTKKKKDPLSERILRKAILKAAEDYADDRKAEEAHDEAVEEATIQSAALTDSERRLTDEMRAWAQGAKNRKDSKAQAVLEWIEDNLKSKGDWNDRRVIIFTEYRTTHQWLHEILASHEYGEDRLSILHGGMDQKDREVIKAAFQFSPAESPVRILLATDAASEGIDLQNHCNCLIHLEIPYNPNVMEQRNGRIDRHGQKEREVQIWHPADGGDIKEDSVGGHEDDIIRALKKLDAMREDMGSVNPVIAPQMSELIEGKRSEFDTRVAEERAAKAKKFFAADRRLEERIAKMHERLQETRDDFHLTPERICNAVKTGLALDKKPALQTLELEGAPSGTVYKMPALAGSWARCMEGLRHPYSQKVRPITFDHDVAKGREDVVLIHLNHLLVQRCLRLLREEVWKGEDRKRLNRVVVRTLPDNELSDMAVIVSSRLVITGGNHYRLHEELTFSGGYLKDKSFSRESKVTLLNEWIEKAESLVPSKKLFDNLVFQFGKHEPSIRQTIDARSKDRLKYLTNTLESLKNKEIKNITTILEELEKSLKKQIEKSKEPEQLEIRYSEFDDNERTQLKRDINALKARLTRIPEEREKEIAAIERRYANFVDRTFPVAIIFLVPDSMAKGGLS